MAVVGILGHFRCVNLHSLIGASESWSLLSFSFSFLFFSTSMMLLSYLKLRSSRKNRKTNKQCGLQFLISTNNLYLQ